MAKYKVTALSVGGKSNKVHQYGEILSADAFENPVEVLIERKLIEYVEEDEPEEEEVLPVTEKAFLIDHVVTPDEAKEWDFLPWEVIQFIVFESDIIRTGKLQEPEPTTQIVTPEPPVITIAPPAANEGAPTGTIIQPLLNVVTPIVPATQPVVEDKPVTTDDGLVEHLVTAADVAKYPDAGLIEGVKMRFSPDEIVKGKLKLK